MVRGAVAGGQRVQQRAPAVSEFSGCLGRRSGLLDLVFVSYYRRSSFASTLSAVHLPPLPSIDVIAQPAPSSADEISSELSSVLADDRRLVALDGVHNFRDLGGYPACGGTTRWGMVYRADGLQRLTADDLIALRERGLSMVIDLRTDGEINERGRYPIEQHAVAYHHLPVLDRTWQAEDVPEFGTDHDFLMWAYRDMLRVGGDKLAAALGIIATADATPLVFHCAAGKDRTGLLAALLLSILGVPDNYIAADYAKTEEGMVRMRAWAMEQSPEAAARMASSPQHYYASPPGVIHTLLAELRQEHGSVIDFVGGIGVSDATITALRDRLVAPNE